MRQWQQRRLTCECVWMHAMALRCVYAARNSGVHADGLSGLGGRRKYSVVARFMTNRSNAFIRSLDTPEGAM